MHEEEPTGLEKAKKAKSTTCACQIDQEQLIQADLTQDQNPSYMHQAYMHNPNIGPDNLDFLCDITIRSNDGEEHRAHKILLCMLGRKFEGIYLENNDQDLINLDVSNEALNQILASVYKGRCDFNETNVWEVGQFAKDFGTRSIQKHLGDHVLSKMDLGNALEMQNIADSLLCPRIAGMTKLFILRNFQEINRMTNDMFGAMPIADLESLLKEDKLNTSEEELFLAMEKWAGKDGNRQAAVASILHVVRFTLMSGEFFEEKVMTSHLAKEPGFTKRLDAVKAYFHHLARPKRKCSISRRGGMKREKFRIPNDIIMTSGGWTTSITPQGNGPNTDLQIYNMRADKWWCLKWSSMNHCNERWAYHGMVELDKKIYLFGGYNGHVHVKMMACFDLISGQWSPDKPSMNSRRCYLSATKCGGKIYACGGARSVPLPTGAVDTERLRSAEVYDPKSNQWSTLPPMKRVRSDASAISFEGKVYIMGGFDGTEILSSIEIYDPATNEWTYGPSMLSRRSGLKAIVCGGLIYAIGGYDGNDRLSSVERLNPHRLLPGWQQVAPMLSQRSNFAIASLEDKIQVIGGYRPGGVFAGCEIYDPEANTWTPCASLARGQSAVAAVTISDLPTHHSIPYSTLF